MFAQILRIRWTNNTCSTAIDIRTIVQLERMCCLDIPRAKYNVHLGVWVQGCLLANITLAQGYILQCLYMEYAKGPPFSLTIAVCRTRNC